MAIIPSKQNQDTVERMFAVAKVSDSEQLELVGRLMVLEGAAKEYALIMLANCPPGRELSVALTLFEQSLLMAEAAITRGEA